MPEKVIVRTPLRVTVKIEKDPSGLYVGHLAEYPGILTQARTRRAARAKLLQLLREISLEHPEELALFR